MSEPLTDARYTASASCLKKSAQKEKRKKSKKQKKSIEDLKMLYFENNIDDIRGRHGVAVDPNKRNLLFFQHGNGAKKRYTAAQRRVETGEKCHRQFRKELLDVDCDTREEEDGQTSLFRICLKNSVPINLVNDESDDAFETASEMSEGSFATAVTTRNSRKIILEGCGACLTLQAELASYSHTSTHLDDFIGYLQKRREVSAALDAFYRIDVHRNIRLSTYTRTQRSEARLV